MTHDTRSLTFLDDTGDTTITWDEDSDDKLLDIIQRKMDEGFVFYIVKQTAILKVNRFVKAKNIEEIKKSGSVTIRDEALEKLFFEGTVGIAKTPANDKIDTVRKAANANDVVSNQSVAVRPRRGG